MEYTENTMETYIRKEKEVCLAILAGRKKNLKNFLDVIQENSAMKRLLVLATGSSANAVNSAKYYLEELLGVEVDVKLPFLFSNYQRFYDKEALLIGVSQSGKSFSTIVAMKKARDLGYRHSLVLTADLDSAIVKEVRHAVDIGCGKETVGYVTMGFTATVLTLMLMAVEGALALGRIDLKRYSDEIIKLESAVDQIDVILEKAILWYENNSEELTKGKRFLTIAYGPCLGTAMESCTKITETVREPMSSHELEEYMHGPYLELNKDHHIFFIKHGGMLEDRMDALRNYIGNVTDHCYSISKESQGSDQRTLYMNLEMEENICPLLYVLPFQILSFRLALDKDIDLSIDQFPDFDKILKSKI